MNFVKAPKFVASLKWGYRTKSLRSFVITHNYVIVLVYNLCSILFISCPINCLQDRVCFSQNQLNLLLEKMGKKQSLSTENRLKS